MSETRNYAYKVKDRGVENDLTEDERRAILLGMEMVNHNDVFAKALPWVIEFYETKVKGSEVMNLATDLDVRRIEALAQLVNTLAHIDEEEARRKRHE